ncbi:hypothetical protein Ancab_036166 [Ancistrocladus abbreviatus]
MEASNDDEWHPDDREPIDVYDSSGVKEVHLDSDSDRYEPCLRDEWFIHDSNDEVDFEISAYLKGRFFEYNKDGTVSLEVGLMFYDKSPFLEVLRDFAMLNRFDM